MNISGFLSDIVTSKDNPSVKRFRKLMTSKKERFHNRLFALEGSRLVFHALKNNAPVKKIFVTESALKKYADKLESIKLRDIDLIAISDELGVKIADTGKTQGIFAECAFIDKTDKLSSLKKRGRYAVLYQLQDPGNAGMIIRTADALGLDGVIFTYIILRLYVQQWVLFSEFLCTGIYLPTMFLLLWTVLKLIHMPLLWTEMPLTLKQLTSETEEVLSLVMRGTDCLKK